MLKILIIEDEVSIRRVLNKVLLEENNKFQITEASNGVEGIDEINKQKFNLILCDIKMPKKDGMEVLRFILKKNPEIPTIMISGHGDLDTAVESMRLGAFDYISKPPDLNRLLNSVRSALKNNDFTKKSKSTLKKSKEFEIIGKSKEILNLKDLINKVSLTNAKVLIQGPNGSGKELVAHQIHLNSSRNDYPFIEVNCAAIPSELIESELFGHIKGAFTSAVKDKVGKFEAANGGTIFLDEIGDMSLSAQSKVLRALQEHKIQRVGSERDLIVDVRVIAATNKNLRNEISLNNFREDLFHRLAVIEINVPSLDKRKSDIPYLINHFLKDISKENQSKLKDIDEKAVLELQNFNWSGNVRELRNVVERLTVLSDSEIISFNDVIKFSNKK
ncbi:MAG: Fis family transcriptional regulator [Cryomorphaceae bacterium BACL29 MAG-121220-bin8]|mgnify:CR=1 FL=1|jgi:two-component system, NtrC family, nitrogen regulation response regulator NtrX|nr:MAG: Fis family transcriptional regulator [Cryomorphaceae bacterium BACL29 MAG-121220-bin8]|tara:strand:- start:30547 stop:31713 length:1167 start_codon:yes stop_codon:yes gene_type:complete